MRSLSTAVVTAAVLSVATVAFAESATTALVVSAAFNSRTSLNVSTDVLQFDVGSASDSAVTTVDFSARARTASGGQVVLSVERLDEVPQLHGQSSLTFSGVGDGTLSGAVAPTGLTVVSRWSGSGLWHGTMVFALRGRAPGRYLVPVRFVLSAP